MKKIIFIFLMIASINIFSMEENLLNNDDKDLITEWNQMRFFNGKVIAYTAKTYALDSKNNKYVLSISNNSYAYIANFGQCQNEKGYILYQLLNKDAVSKDIILSNKTLAEGDLFVRAITSLEAEEIKNALIAQKAKFAYMWGDNEKLILSHLQFIIYSK